MGTLLGNFIGLLLLIVVGLLGLISIEASAYGLLVVSYGFGFLIFYHNNFAGRMVGDRLSLLLTHDEMLAFRRYNIAIRAPGAGELLSAYFNFVRLIGFIWAGICLWYGLYVLGGLIIAFFFASGLLIVRLNPYLYMGVESRQGNFVAITELALIHAVAKKRELAYSTDPTSDEDLP